MGIIQMCYVTFQWVRQLVKLHVVVCVVVGIELETYHCESSSAELTKYIVGGTLPKKMKDKKAKKAIVWDNRTYEQFGAIPTRDGSLDGTYGVEWVFRPSDLNGMFHDVSHVYGDDSRLHRA